MYRARRAVRCFRRWSIMAVFTYITLADPGNPGATTPQGINDAGQSVGWYGDATGAHGFLLSGGIYTTLNDPLALNGGNTQAYGINDLGQIVGTYLDSNALPHSFLYSGGTYTTIDVPVANSFTFARGIKDKCQIVGYYNDDIGTHRLPFRRRNYTTLGDPLATGHITTYANGINDLGQIVGSYVDGSGEHGFLYNNGTYTSIDDPLAIDGPGRSTIAYGINDLGQIVGSYVNPFPS